MYYSAVIIGAGPGGLACAKKLAENDISVIIIERKSEIGSKVCAGGITWSGLMGKIPDTLIEQAFPLQHITTKHQSIIVSSHTPIIATVNRKKLGMFMAQEAIDAGATLLVSSHVHKIGSNSVEVKNTSTSERITISFDYLIGADGSQSIVRKFLQIPTNNAGIGINYQIPGKRKEMEWHLHTDYFKNGYSWIFPHRDTLSIGAYADKSVMSAKRLKAGLIKWAQTQGIELQNKKCSAEFINFDYRGWEFDNIYLVGDAAGLASALTGEGIYPAIVSGETVAEKIFSPGNCDLSKINKMVKKQRTFQNIVKLTGRNTMVSSLLAELGLVFLRYKILSFRNLEMGH